MYGHKKGNIKSEPESLKWFETKWCEMFIMGNLNKYFLTDLQKKYFSQFFTDNINFFDNNS